MTPFQKKVATLLQLSQQYQQLCTKTPSLAKNLAVIQELIQTLQQEQINWSKSPSSNWLNLFEAAYTKYDQFCCANKLTTKIERQLKKEMQKAINQGKRQLKKEGEGSSKLQEDITEAEKKLNTLQCERNTHNDPHQESHEIFVPHVTDDKHYIDMWQNANDFFSLFNGEYQYNKGLSDFLMTPEYIDSILHELTTFMQAHKQDIKNAIQQGGQNREEIKKMKAKLSLMREKIKEVKKARKQALREVKKEEKSLAKEGLVDDIQRHKGNIDGYLDAAYISKFKKAGEDYVANCQKEEPSERVAAYLKESMERLIVQLDQEIKDAECTELITEADKAQMNSIKEQMEKSIITLERDCTFQGLPFYIIEDIHPTTTTDHCGNIIALKATRKVTQVANPDFKPQTIDYSKIIAATQDSTAILNIADKKGQTALPETALQPTGFDIDNLNTYFENNPNQTEYRTSLDLETGTTTPMIYTISDGELEPITDENNIVIEWKATRIITAKIAPDCIPKLKWKSLYTKQQDQATTEPNTISEGSGEKLPPEIKGKDYSLIELNQLLKNKKEIKEELSWTLNVSRNTRSLDIPFMAGRADLADDPVGIVDLQFVVQTLQANPFNRVTLQPRTAFRIDDPIAIPLLAGRRQTLLRFFNSLNLGNQINIIINNSSYGIDYDVIATITIISVSIDD
jgi:hypothetical protein